MPILMSAQTYTSLWKQVREAQTGDLPQTEQETLRQIVAKAESEGNYGQLLKAELQCARSMCAVSPDSLKPVVEQLKQREQQTADNHVLQAIYQCVLGYIYEHNRWLDEDRHEEIGREYYAKALAHPDELAAVKATNYEPFVVRGNDSRYFGDDLLSLIGYQANSYGLLRDYYQATGNRRATLLCSLMQLHEEMPTETEPLNKSRHIQRLDSLIEEYQDLTECGEAAIDRYDYMDDNTDATAEQKWQYINMALERWGAWQRMNELRNTQRRLTNPQFEAEVQERVTIPQRSQQVQLKDLRSITELTLRVYKANVEGDTDLDADDSNDYRKLKPLLTALPNLTQTRQYVGKRPYELFEDSIELAGLPVGVYMLEIESQPSTHVSRCLYFVSDIRLLAQLQPGISGEGSALRLVAVNATSGQPVKGATVVVETGYGANKSIAQLTSNEQGECIQRADQSRSHKMRAFTSNDKACPYMNVWGHYIYNDDLRQTASTDIYTDRAIYRPGQTVHAAAILYKTANGREHTADSGREVLMQLRDANYQVVSEQHVVTDEFGTCTAQFTLPTQGLTGNFTIRANGASHSFRVEEYKRPAFEVDIPRVGQDYEDGDTVVARGTVRSYAGVPVQGATVKYKVMRRRAFWWMSYSRYWGGGFIGTGSNDEVMAEGETVTDDKGQFTADMPMVLPKTKHPMFYNFVLTADVTDQAGETHQGTMSLPLGNRKTAFSATLPEKVLSEGGVKMAFHQQNAAGIDLDATVRYRFDNGRWQEAKTNEVMDIPQMRSGKHTLHAICQTDTLDQDFVVFSIDDTRPATDTRSWFFASSEQFPMSGEPVTVQAGSSDKNVHMVYSVISGDTLLESGTVDISNELINRKFVYKEAYGNGVLLTFAWMKEGRPYTWSTTIRRPMPDMHLDMKWKTFRNRLVPGQEEEWTLTVTKPDGTPAAAQLMATLYDKSLDQLTPHSWSLAPLVWLPTPSTQWENPLWGAANMHGEKNIQWMNVPAWQFNHFDSDVFPSYRYPIPYRSIMRKNVMVAQPEMADDVVALQGRVAGLDIVDEASPSTRLTGIDNGIEEAVVVAETAGESQQTAAVQLRENLQETAFFMPQLVCDETGQVTMKFTLPESLTTWCFLGVAHTRDMMYGQMSDEAVARKDVMIQPNMPRFLRQGDEGTISARIINMSDEPVSGTAMLQLLDPETERVVLEQKQQVTVPDSSTIAATFAVSPNAAQLAEYTLLIARVSISTPQHSDGEQHYLPLLPNTERVTVTVPFTQTTPGTKEIDLKKLLPASLSSPEGDTNVRRSNEGPSGAVGGAKLTVEYTNNPVWLMVQALPAIGHPYDKCAVCQATSLYANSIGRHILDQNPTVKHVFEQWKHEQGQETSLNSALQKDGELKDLLLNETPWVMDADQEQEQKERLADFFDRNLINNRLSTALENLGSLQNSDGSWSWWPGMSGSQYMTTAISTMLVRLNQMTGQQDETRELLEGAFSYLGNGIVRLVEEMKQEERRGVKQSFPSRQALDWLYICALDGRELSKDVQQANDYLKNLLKKETRNQTIMEKALSAIILDNKAYVRSLKEWTVYKEDMGRYYDTQRAGYSWRDYKIPTQVAAIEAMKRLTPQDTVTIAEMQRWLLQEKRTQAWDTPLNSADAIYAFLDGNSQALAPQPKTTLSIDGRTIDTSDATAGIGYVKSAQPYHGEKTFTAEKTSTGTSWGAVYAQFTQPARDIADQQSGISVKREILVKDGNATFKPLSSPLKVGDRITVRITIEAERDYDFVQVQDKRAACMEPVKQLSGYNWSEGYFCAPKDYATSYFFDQLSKGRHVIETEYYIDREGTYETGSCSVQCAYSPEFHGVTKSVVLEVKK